jgi:hypothetical protein
MTAPDETHCYEQVSDGSSAGNPLTDKASGVCALAADRSDLQTVLVLENVKRDERVAVRAQTVAAHQEPPVAGSGIGDDGKAGFVDILLVIDLRECPGRRIRVIIDLRALHEGVIEPAVKEVDCDSVDEDVGVADEHGISRPRIRDEVDPLACDSDSPVAETVRRMGAEACRGELKRPGVRADVTVDGDARDSETQTAGRRDPLDRIGCLRHRSARHCERTDDSCATEQPQRDRSEAHRTNRSCE